MHGSDTEWYVINMAYTINLATVAEYNLKPLS